MAITQTSALQPQYHREVVVLTDGFGLQRKIYVHASQVANRTTIIANVVAVMEANEASMTALQTAYNAAQAAPAATPSPAPSTTPTTASTTTTPTTKA